MLALCLFLKVRVSMAVLLSTGPLHPPHPPRRPRATCIPPDALGLFGLSEPLVPPPPGGSAATCTPQDARRVRELVGLGPPGCLGRPRRSGRLWGVWTALAARVIIQQGGGGSPPAPRGAPPHHGFLGLQGFSSRRVRLLFVFYQIRPAASSFFCGGDFNGGAREPVNP